MSLFAVIREALRNGLAFASDQVKIGGIHVSDLFDTIHAIDYCSDERLRRCFSEKGNSDDHFRFAV
jgi:hypothetical protein